MQRAIDKIKGHMSAAKHILSDRYQSGMSVNFDELHELPLKEQVQFDSAGNKEDKITVICIFKSESVVITECVFPAFSQLGIHIHEDCSETIRILKGKVLESVSSLYLEQGYQAKIDQNGKHNFIALDEEAHLICIFHKTS